jgi:cytochrome P450
MITARMAEDIHAKHDLFSIIQQANSELPDPSQGIRESEIWLGAHAFFPAGAFSTSTAISAALFTLVKNKKVYDTLAAEIRSAFELEADIRSGPKLVNCQYLRACVEETLRIAPPVPGTMWGEAAPGGPSLIVDGHVVPPGTRIGVNIFTLHHNEEYFPDPFVFNPDRWLHGSEILKKQRKMMQDASAPFSLGYRGCAGKPMAYYEIVKPSAC